MKIIVADDTDLEREHLWALLERNGHDVITAIDGIQALNEFSRHPDVDLIITDYKMQGVNGLDLLSNLKSISPGVRVWLASSFLSQKTEKAAYELGAEKAIWKTNLEHELCRARLIRDSDISPKGA